MASPLLLIHFLTLWYNEFCLAHSKTKQWSSIDRSHQKKSYKIAPGNYKLLAPSGSLFFGEIASSRLVVLLKVR